MTESRLEQWAEEHWERLYRAACLMIGNRDGAADVVQETFLEATKAVGSFRGESSAYTWLYRILLRRVSRWRQKAGRALEASRLTERSVISPESRMTRDESARMVIDALAELSEPLRTVTVMKYFDDLSYVDIANLLQVSEAVVRMRLARARARLRQTLGVEVKELVG
jgi:RNA polymerase sigma-70 factor (ECF subfamily)